MSAPIISAAEAQRLNRLFQDKIDSRFFLFCNYEPSFPPAISEDGKYFSAVQDLYRFAIDSTCIVKDCRYYVPAPRRYQLRNLQHILEIIQLLRSVMDHNHSDSNGHNEASSISAYKSWIATSIGKDMPDTAEDYKKLNQVLRNMAADLISELESYIDLMSRDPDLESLKRKIIERTLYWYSHNTKTEIYEGQLLDAYLARSTAAGHTDVLTRPKHVLHIKLEKWMEAALCFPDESKINDCIHQIQSIDDALSRMKAPGNPIAASMTAQQREAFTANLHSQLAKYTAERDNAQQQLDNLQQKIGFKCSAYFYETLTHRLTETMQRMEHQGAPYTMLPQSLLQEDIERRFSQVASPEGDF